MRGEAMIAAALLVAACGGPAGQARNGAGAGDATAAQEVRPMTPLVPAPRVEEALRLVVRDDAAWAAAWARLHRGDAAAPPRPAIDFAKEMVLVAALGMRRTGGFVATISRAELAGGVMRVEVLERQPGAGCMTTQALTYPVALARVARHDGEVEFTDRVAVADCR
jgi:protease stability complex PrcB-like protein